MAQELMIEGERVIWPLFVIGPLIILFILVVIGDFYCEIKWLNRKNK